MGVEVWGLNNGTIRADGWDYVHLTTWNFLPFLLRRVGTAPGWIVNVSFVTWCAAIAALVWVLHRLRQTTSHCEETF